MNNLKHLTKIPLYQVYRSHIDFCNSLSSKINKNITNFDPSKLKSKVYIKNKQ